MVWNSLLFSLLISLIVIVEMRHCLRMHNYAVKMAYKGLCRSSTSTVQRTTTRLFSIHHPPSMSIYSSASDDDMISNNLVQHVEYKRGQLIKVKVVSFGPMGASVSIAEDNRRGLILQKELAMFRDRRDREQVVVGEVLDGYVERVRETGNVDVALRPVDVARIEVVKKEVMEALGTVYMFVMMFMMALMVVVVMMMMIVATLIFQSMVSP